MTAKARICSVIAGYNIDPFIFHLNSFAYQRKVQFVQWCSFNHPNLMEWNSQKSPSARLPPSTPLVNEYLCALCQWCWFFLNLMCNRHRLLWHKLCSARHRPKKTLGVFIIWVSRVFTSSSSPSLFLSLRLLFVRLYFYFESCSNDCFDANKVNEMASRHTSSHILNICRGWASERASERDTQKANARFDGVCWVYRKYLHTAHQDLIQLIESNKLKWIVYAKRIREMKKKMFTNNNTEYI